MCIRIGYTVYTSYSFCRENGRLIPVPIIFYSVQQGGWAIKVKVKAETCFNC